MTRKPTLGARQGRGIQRWWNRAFALLLCVSLATGVASVFLVAGLVERFDRTAAEADRETALLAALVPALNDELGLSHSVIDFGSDMAAPYLAADRAARVLFRQGETTFDGQQLVLVRKARAQWLEMYAFLRPVAADAVSADRFEASLGDDDQLHHALSDDQRKLSVIIGAINADVHREARRGFADARDVEHEVVAVVIAMSALAVAVVLVLARRLRRRVILPVHELAQAALAFGAGELERRPVVVQDDEIGDLAARFSTMADAIAAQHVHLAEGAYRDPLTGLANRRAFVEDLEGATESDELFGVMFIDLDDFKLVNDSFGHAAGDELLTVVADRLRQAVRSSDVVARLGGDEFAVLLRHPAERNAAQAVAERIQLAFDGPVMLEAGVVRTGVSVGIALREAPLQGTEELMGCADSAMYAAKSLGKGRAEFFDPVRDGHRLTERVAPPR